MRRITEEEYREAARIWKNRHPEESYINEEEILLPSGVTVPLAKRLRTIKMHRKRLTEEQREFWDQFEIKEKVYPTKKEQKKAAEIWMSTHPGKRYVEEEEQITLPTGKTINFGKMVRFKKMNPSRLTEEEKELWAYFDVSKNPHFSQEEKKKAAEIWMSAHPGERYVEEDEKVTLPNGKTINFGKIVRDKKKNPSRSTEEEKELWTNFDISKNPHFSQEEKKKAAEIWMSAHPGERYVEEEEIVTLPNGKTINLGRIIRTAKTNFAILTKEEKEFWSFFNVSKNSPLRDEEVREVAKIWKEEHRDEKYIRRGAKVTIESGKKVNLGQKITYMRRRPERFTEEEREFWQSNYHIFERIYPTKAEWREAFVIWKREHPEDTHVKFEEKAELANGKVLALGNKMFRIMNKLKTLPIEEQRFWGEYRVYYSNKPKSILIQENRENKRIKYWKNNESVPSVKISKKEKEQIAIEIKCREAFEKWKYENKEKKASDCNIEIILDNDKKIDMGKRLRRIPSKRLSQEEAEYWTFQNILNEENTSSYQMHKEESLNNLRMEYIDRLGLLDEEKIFWIIKCIKELREKEPSVKDLANLLHIEDETLVEGLKRLKTTFLESDTFPCLNLALTNFAYKYGYKESTLKKVGKLQKVCENDTLEQLVNRALIMECGPITAPSSWIYEKYGHNIKTILNYLNLNSNVVLRTMSQEIMPLEEVIADSIFQNKMIPLKYQWIELPFQYLKDKIKMDTTPEKISQMMLPFTRCYHMNKKERLLLKDSLIDYSDFIKKYRKMDVGLEINEERRMEKIRNYHFSAEDIEDAFFMPLELNCEELTENAKRFYDRKCLLRQYIIDWQEYTDDEKEKIIKREKIKKEEQYHIETMRTKIDEAISMQEKSLVKVKK